MRIFLALRVFFKVLFSGVFAKSVREVIAGKKVQQAKPAAKPIKKQEEKPVRSEALTLLAALQREARFLDIVMEPLGEYSDEQIGAAAKDVLRDTSKVLERIFAIEAVSSEEEGAEITTPDNFDAQKFHLTGSVSGDGPFTGELTHHGWQATKCEIPKWSGSKASRLIIAPVEIQVQ